MSPPLSPDSGSHTPHSADTLPGGGHQVEEGWGQQGEEGWGQQEEEGRGQ